MYNYKTTQYKKYLIFKAICIALVATLLINEASFATDEILACLGVPNFSNKAAVNPVTGKVKIGDAPGYGLLCSLVVDALRKDLVDPTKLRNLINELILARYDCDYLTRFDFANIRYENGAYIIPHKDGTPESRFTTDTTADLLDGDGPPTHKSLADNELQQGSLHVSADRSSANQGSQERENMQGAPAQVIEGQEDTSERTVPTKAISGKDVCLWVITVTPIIAILFVLWYCRANLGGVWEAYIVFVSSFAIYRWRLGLFNVFANIWGHSAASLIDKDKHLSRFIVIAIWVFCVAIGTMPYYVAFTRAFIPDWGIWAHWMRPLMDLFVMCQFLIIAGFYIMGVRERVIKPESKGRILTKNWIRETRYYVYKKLRLIYGRDGYLKVAMLFWMPIIHFTYYSAYSNAVLMGIAISIAPLFAVVAAFFVMQQPKHPLSPYPKLNKLLKHSYYMPLIFISIGIPVAASLGHMALALDGIAALWTGVVGCTVYHIWNWFIQRYVLGGSLLRIVKSEQEEEVITTPLTGKKIVIFGGGVIGRGFIAELYRRAGYEIVIVDVDEDLINRVNREGSYPLYLIGEKNRKTVITDAKALHINNEEEIAKEVVDADILALAVPEKPLESVCAAIGRGLENRLTNSERAPPIDIVIARNMPHPSRDVRQFVLDNITDPNRETIDASTGFVETVIGRMMPIIPDNVRKFDPSCVFGEEYSRLPLDKSQFKGSLPEDVDGLEFYDNLTPLEDRKLLMHNCAHAMLAYLGYQKRYKYIYEAIRDESIREVVEGALNEVGKALIRKYHFGETEMEEYIADILDRFDNEILADTIARVGRAPIRKLGLTDRLVGAARLALESGIEPVNLVKGIAAATQYYDPKDEEAVELHQILNKKGLRGVLKDICEIDPDSKLGQMIKPGRVINLKLITVITIIEAIFFIGVRVIIPDLPLVIIPGVPLKVFLSFVIFITLGEIFGQVINARKRGNFNPILSDFSGKKVLLAFGTAVILFGWFWPLSYSLWTPLPPLLMALSDMITTAPISLTIIFSLHGIIESLEKKGDFTFKEIYFRKIQELRCGLIAALPYWGLGLTLVFASPFSIVTQRLLISMLEPPFVIYLYYLANKEPDPDKTLMPRTWTMFVLPVVIIWNFWIFTRCVNIPMLFIGACPYFLILFFGFKESPMRGKGSPWDDPRGEIHLGITSPGRNAHMDVFIKDYLEVLEGRDEKTVVDLGIGYPPVTTVELAETLSGIADVIGIDINVPDYVVEFSMEEKNYSAFFKRSDSARREDRMTFVARGPFRRGALEYDYGEIGSAEEEEIRAEAWRVRDDLMRFSRGRDYEGHSSSIVFDPIRRYESEQPNLKFVRAGKKFELPFEGKADIVRAVNVFLYYDEEESLEAVKKIGRRIKDKGILIIGDNHEFIVYQKINGKMKPKEVVVRFDFDENGIFQNAIQLDLLRKNGLIQAEELTQTLSRYDELCEVVASEFSNALDNFERRTGSERGIEDYAACREFVANQMVRSLTAQGLGASIDRNKYFHVSLQTSTSVSGDLARTEDRGALSPEERTEVARIIEPPRYREYEISYEKIIAYAGLKGTFRGWVMWLILTFIVKPCIVRCPQIKLSNGRNVLGTAFRRTIYITYPMFEKPVELGRTLIHEMGAMSCLPHWLNIILERFIPLSGAEASDPVEAVTYEDVSGEETRSSEPLAIANHIFIALDASLQELEWQEQEQGFKTAMLPTKTLTENAVLNIFDIPEGTKVQGNVIVIGHESIPGIPLALCLSIKHYPTVLLELNGHYAGIDMTNVPKVGDFVKANIDQDMKLWAYFNPYAYVMFDSEGELCDIFSDPDGIVPEGYRCEVIPLLPGVFNAEHFSSEISARATFEIAKPGMDVLVIGTGLGLEARIAAETGANVDAIDINELAVENTKLTCSDPNIAGRVNVFLSDLFAKVPRKQYDLIVFNIPHIADESSKPKESKAYRNNTHDYGGKLLKRVVSQVADYMKDDGQAVIVNRRPRSDHNLRVTDILEKAKWLEVEENGFGVLTGSIAYILTKRTGPSRDTGPYWDARERFENLPNPLALRIFDIVISIILSIPALIIIFIARRMSAGTIFQGEERAGYKGKVFTVYTLHSILNYEVTPMEKSLHVLASYSAQILNVLKGDMSIFGPQPLPPEKVNAIYAKRVLSKRKPGMIDIFRAVRGFDRKEYPIDLHHMLAEYEMRNWSIKWAIRIVLIGLHAMRFKTKVEKRLEYFGLEAEKHPIVQQLLYTPTRRHASEEGIPPESPLSQKICPIEKRWEGIPQSEIHSVLYPACGRDTWIVFDMLEHFKEVEDVYLVDSGEQFSIEDIMADFHDWIGTDEDYEIVSIEAERDNYVLHVNDKRIERTVRFHFVCADYTNPLESLAGVSDLTIVKYPGPGGVLSHSTEHDFYNNVFNHTKRYIYIENAKPPKEDMYQERLELVKTNYISEEMLGEVNKWERLWWGEYMLFKLGKPPMADREQAPPKEKSKKKLPKAAAGMIPLLRKHLAKHYSGKELFLRQTLYEQGLFWSLNGLLYSFGLSILPATLITWFVVFIGAHYAHHLFGITNMPHAPPLWSIAKIAFVNAVFVYPAIFAFSSLAAAPSFSSLIFSISFLISAFTVSTSIHYFANRSLKLGQVVKRVSDYFEEFKERTVILVYITASVYAIGCVIIKLAADLTHPMQVMFWVYLIDLVWTLGVFMPILGSYKTESGKMRTVYKEAFLVWKKLKGIHHFYLAAFATILLGVSCGFYYIMPHISPAMILVLLPLSMTTSLPLSYVFLEEREDWGRKLLGIGGIATSIGFMMFMEWLVNPAFFANLPWIGLGAFIGASVGVADFLIRKLFKDIKEKKYLYEKDNKKTLDFLPMVIVAFNYIATLPIIFVANRLLGISILTFNGISIIQVFTTSVVILATFFFVLTWFGTFKLSRIVKYPLSNIMPGISSRSMIGALIEKFSGGQPFASLYSLFAPIGVIVSSFIASWRRDTEDTEDDESGNGQCPSSYFSDAKLKRYCEGPGEIFKNTPMEGELQRAFTEGAPRIIQENGQRNIEINVSQMYFLNWYEQRFGLIPQDKPSTFIRGYIHDLFHTVLYKNDFHDMLRKRMREVKDLNKAGVVQFLNSFNERFAVLGDASGEAISIGEEDLEDYLTNRNYTGRLITLWEEVGAKYMSTRYEDGNVPSIYNRYVGYRSGFTPLGLNIVLEESISDTLLQCYETGDLDGAVSAGLREFAPEMGLAVLVNFAIPYAKFISLLEGLTGVSSEFEDLQGVVLKQDDHSKEYYAKLKQDIKLHEDIADLTRDTRKVPVAITWDLGIGSILGEWQMGHYEGYEAFCTVGDAIENALYTDANGVLSEGMKGVFGKEIPVSQIEAIKISQFQEGVKAGIFEVAIRIRNDNGRQEEGSFIVYASKGIPYNARATSEFEGLTYCAGRNPTYVPAVHRISEVPCRQAERNFPITLFSVEKLHEFWEINASLRREGLIVASGEKGMGVYFNKGGSQRSATENVGDIQMEHICKEEMVKILTLYLDIENAQTIVFGVNNGDFVGRLRDGRPEVRLTAAGEFLQLSEKPITEIDRYGVGAYFLHYLLTRREPDNLHINRMVLYGHSVDLDEYTDFIFDPEEIFKGVTKGLVEQLGEAEGVNLMRKWLEAYLSERVQELIDEHLDDKTLPEWIEKARLYLQELRQESPPQESSAASEASATESIVLTPEEWIEPHTETSSTVREPLDVIFEGTDMRQRLAQGTSPLNLAVRRTIEVASWQNFQCDRDIEGKTVILQLRKEDYFEHEGIIYTAIKLEGLSFVEDGVMHCTMLHDKANERCRAVQSSYDAGETREIALGVGEYCDLYSDTGQAGFFMSLITENMQGAPAQPPDGEGDTDEGTVPMNGRPEDLSDEEYGIELFARNYLNPERNAREDIVNNVDFIEPSQPGAVRNPNVLVQDILNIAAYDIDPEKLLQRILELCRQTQYRDTYFEALRLARKGESWKLINTDGLEETLGGLQPLDGVQRMNVDEVEFAVLSHGIRASHDPEEINDFREAIQTLNKMVSEGQKMDEESFKGLHAIIARNLRVRFVTEAQVFFRSTTRGKYRSITGDRDLLIYPSMWRMEGDKFIDVMDDFFAFTDRTEFKALHPVEQAAIVFYLLMSFHPFENGNTRTASLFMNYILMSNNYSPFLLTEENAERFYEMLRFMRTPDDTLAQGFGWFTFRPEDIFNEPFGLPRIRDFAREFSTFLAGQIQETQNMEGASPQPTDGQRDTGERTVPISQAMRGAFDKGMEGLVAAGTEYRGLRESRGPVEPKALILYVDDIWQNAILYDFENTLRRLTEEGGILHGGKIVLYTKDKGLRDVVGQLEEGIRAVTQDVDVIIVTQEEVFSGAIPEHVNSANEVYRLIKELRRTRNADGMPYIKSSDILAIIRGNGISWTELSEGYDCEIPVIILNGISNGVRGIFSFAEAVATALRLINENGAQGWLRTVDCMPRTEHLYPQYLRERREILTKL